MVEINWTDPVLEDIESIAIFISRDSKKYAALQKMNKPNIRELTEGNYKIIYRILSSKRIDILTVHHSAQKLIKKKL